MAGAPKGNTNALKHGLYARHFNADQRAALKRMDWDDFRHEEFMHRAVGEGIFKLLNDLLAGDQPDPGQVSSLVHSLHINTASASTSARTHALLNGERQLGDALSEALADVPFDLEEAENG